MNNRELKKLKKWTDTLTDKELENEYYGAVYEHIGSMDGDIECEYDTIDAIAQKKREEEFHEYIDMLKHLCEERGIKLFEEY